MVTKQGRGGAPGERTAGKGRKPRCPKCGSDDVYTRYEAISPSTEWLRRHCRECTYDWSDEVVTPNPKERQR